MKSTYSGTQAWYLNGQRHRTDGPAIIWPDGTQEWFLTDGPAVIWPDGTQEWFLNGQRHRTDGPAVIWPDGSQYWYLNGQRHRIDGPAVIYPNGTQYWYLNGKQLSEELFLKLTQGPIIDLPPVPQSELR